MGVLLGAILLLTSPAAPSQQHVTSHVARAHTEDDAASRVIFAAATRLPPNVTIPDAYDAAIEAMLRLSPTFRAQCTRIALEPNTRVVVERSLLAPPQSAMTRVDRQA